MPGSLRTPIGGVAVLRRLALKLFPAGPWPTTGLPPALKLVTLHNACAEVHHSAKYTYPTVQLVASMGHLYCWVRHAPPGTWKGICRNGICRHFLGIFYVVSDVLVCRWPSTCYLLMLFWQGS